MSHLGMRIVRCDAPLSSRLVVDDTNFRARHFNPFLDRAGLSRVRVHDLRDTAATLMLENLLGDSRQDLGREATRTQSLFD